MKRSTDDLMQSTSIVMVTLDEERSIGKVVDDLRRVAQGAEIVIVDSSSDRTPEIAEAMGCSVLRQYPPQGYGLAMHRGLTAARGEFIVTLDCDQTYPVEAIPLLVRKLEDENLDLVSASRLGRRPRSMPIANYAANLFFCLLARVICHSNSTDLHTGMRAYRREVLSYPYDPGYMALPVELQLGPSMAGFSCQEIFIDYLEREGTSKLQRFAGTIATLRRIWRCRWFLNSFRDDLVKQKAKAGVDSDG